MTQVLIITFSLKKNWWGLQRKPTEDVWKIDNIIDIVITEYGLSDEY